MEVNLLALAGRMKAETGMFQFEPPGPGGEDEALQKGNVCSLLIQGGEFNRWLTALKLPSHHISRAIHCLKGKCKNKHTEKAVALLLYGKFHIRSLAVFLGSESLHGASLFPLTAI